MRLAHRQRGSGPPLVLVTGIGQVARRWDRVVAGLVDTFTVVTVDNRGAGETGPVDETFTMEDMASDVVETMTAIGHGRFGIAGWSMGGMIAQQVVAQAPEHVEALALVSTWGATAAAVKGDPSIFADGAEHGPDDAMGRAWPRLCGAEFVREHPEVVEEQTRIGRDAATPAVTYVQQLMAIAAWDPGDAVVRAGVPCLVLHGTDDILIPYPNGVVLAERLGVELVTFEGSGHGLEFERTDELVARFRKHFAP